MFSNKKKKKQHTTTVVEIDEYTLGFERDFSLCAGHSKRASITNTDVEEEREREISHCWLVIP